MLIMIHEPVNTICTYHEVRVYYNGDDVWFGGQQTDGAL